MSHQAIPSLTSRAKGAIIGLAACDAVPGTFPEVTAAVFREWSRYPNNHKLNPGEWTDDTSMALCMAESINSTGELDLADHIRRYRRWMNDGHLSSTGACFDIGLQTRSALGRRGWREEPILAKCADPRVVGSNGCIMRLVPVPVAFAADPVLAVENSGLSSATTHSTPACFDGARLLGAVLVSAMQGERDKRRVVTAAPLAEYFAENPLCDRIERLRQLCYEDKGPSEVHATSRVDECLEVALWGFLTTDSFVAGCLKVVNRGDDADTSGAVYGQIAGAYYGVEGIPEEWRQQLAKAELVDSLAQGIADRLAAAMEGAAAPTA